MNDKKEVNLEQSNKITNNLNNNKSKVLIIILVLIIIITAVTIFILLFKDKNNNDDKNYEEIIPEQKESKYRITSNSLENFDLYFLQLENEKINKIYSPLSIKYALGMLEDGTYSNSKEQISNIIGDYNVKKYINSENMSFANAMFVNELYKNSIKQDYKNILLNKYNADVVLDSFKSADVINFWVSDKTLKLIPTALDNLDSNTVFVLVNALGIDMEWEEKFLKHPGVSLPVAYKHEKFSWGTTDNVSSNKFDNTQNVSGMKIIASLNNYDIVNTLGEDKIRETVGNEFRKYLQDPRNEYETKLYLKGDNSEENINKVINEYLNAYIKEINTNYKRVDESTDFSIYVDDNVKVFAKNLKEYDGTTLQYIGIMPTSMDLSSFIENTNSEKINEIINNLKELKTENFKDGVVTKITGYIPKFKFDYKLDLENDLKKLGITDIFDSSKANLTGITSEKNVYIEATHKANIEFTQDGIKAAAVTTLGGLGAGGAFDYLYDVPVEEIDLTFDKPYMFLIRDKETGEVWFTGTVYEPLSWEEEPENK